MPTTPSKPQPKYRRPLNTHQIQLLITLYKFRFATTHLIAKSQGTKYPRVILARLRVMVDQDYVGQNYDKSYKIKGKPATYFLRPNGITYLKQQPYASPKLLRSIYQYKRAKDTTIAHYLHVFSVYVEFKQLYPDTFNFFGKSELAEQRHMPTQLPDAYLSRVDKANKLSNDFFLECFEEATSYPKLVDRVRKHLEYAADKVWEKIKDRPTPIILMLCETKTLQRRMIRLAARELDNSSAILTFLATTTEALKTAKSPDDAIWHDAEEPGEAVSLNNL